MDDFLGVSVGHPPFDYFRHTESPSSDKAKRRGVVVVNVGRKTSEGSIAESSVAGGGGRTKVDERLAQHDKNRTDPDGRRSS